MQQSNQQDVDHDTVALTKALAVAVQQGKHHVVQQLLAHDVTRTAINAVSADRHRKTPLVVAIEQHHESIALLLIEQRADLDIVSRNGTALQYACRLNSLSIATALVHANASVDGCGSHVYTPLQYACRNGSQSLALLLLDRKADINHTHHAASRQSPVYLAARHGFESLALALVQRNADMMMLPIDSATPSTTNTKCVTLLHWAAYHDSCTLAQRLIDGGVSVNHSDSADATPLHWASNRKVTASDLPTSRSIPIGACEHSHRDLAPTSSTSTAQYTTCVAELLIRHNAIVDARDSLLNTPMHHAAKRGNVQLVAMLIEELDKQRATERTISLSNHRCMSALALAIVNRRHAVMRYLIEQRATCPATRWSRSALAIACSVGNLTAVEQLLQLDCHLTERGPLQLATKHNKLALLQALLQHHSGDYHVNCTNHTNASALHYAAANNRQELALYLLQHHANVNATDCEQQSALYWAARTGGSSRHKALASSTASMIGLLLQHQADLEARDKSHRTALHVACLNNHVAAAQVLLQQYACNVNVTDCSKSTPLHMAARVCNDQPHLPTLLLDHGADLDARDYLATAFESALSCHNYGIAQLLLERNASVDVMNSLQQLTRTYGHTITNNSEAMVHLAALLIDLRADINNINHFDGRSPLHSCMKFANAPLAKLLLDRGADVNATDWKGSTMLHMAAGLNDVNLVAMILSANNNNIGSSNDAVQEPLHMAEHSNSNHVANLSLSPANVNATDKQGNTPLHRACMYEQWECSDEGHLGPDLQTPSTVQLLLDHRAAIDAINSQGHTPLIEACIHRNHQSALYLLQRRSMVHLVSATGRTALHEAVARGNDPLAMVLIEAGSPLHLIDHQGQSVLHDAAKMNALDSSAYELLSRGVSVNVIDKHGVGALHNAVSSNNLRLVQALLDRRADVNAGAPIINESAVMRYKSAILSLLLEHQAHVNRPDRNNATPLHYAVLNTNITAALWLIDHGADINIKTSPTHFRPNMTAIQCLVHDAAAQALLNQRGMEL
jgi:ankyrin repeat protein